MLFRVYFFNGFHFLDKIEKMVNCWSIIFLRDVNIFNKTREETLQTSITYNKYKIFTRQSFLFKISKSKVLQKYYSWIYDTDIYSNSIPLLIYAKALSKMEIYLIHGLFFDSTPLRRTSISKGSSITEATMPIFPPLRVIVSFGRDRKPFTWVTEPGTTCYSLSLSRWVENNFST